VRTIENGREVGRREPVAVVSAREITRRFRGTVALDGVSMTIQAGRIHALLGPNGAGKTTLIRILAGLASPTEGSVSVLGDRALTARELRDRVGFIPAGDRTFYLRLSGLENLAFFARLHGLRRRDAVARSRAVLEAVGLADAATRPVGGWSHGMQKRLSVARALLIEPDVLLVDEATHDLDPDGAQRIRMLVSGLASRGTAVLWATQRIEEIRGFADTVTLLAAGAVRFEGSVADLADRGASGRYVLRLAGAALHGDVGRARLQRVLGASAAVSLPLAGSAEHVVLEPHAGRSVGEAIAVLVEAGVAVLACRQERSEVEEAFLSLSAEAGA
jgi:ABC-2 type transport system ATP-binding protein